MSNYKHIEEINVDKYLPDGNYQLNFCKMEKWHGNISLILDSQYITETMDFYMKINATRLVLNSCSGFHLRDVNFLLMYTFVTALSIFGSWVDKSALYALENIKSLSICDFNSDFDLRKMPWLNSFYGFINNELILPKLMPNMQKLDLSKFKGTDIGCLPYCPKLEDLCLIQSTIKSLNGIERSPLLTKLKLSYCRNLSDISQLKNSNIEWLWLDACKNIENLMDVLKTMTSLKGLHIKGNISIPSLKFIKNLPQLQYFWFFLNVEDGDMSPLEKIYSVNFNNKRHYTSKVEDFWAKIPDEINIRWGENSTLVK